MAEYQDQYKGADGAKSTEQSPMSQPPVSSSYPDDLLHIASRLPPLKLHPRPKVDINAIIAPGNPCAASGSHPSAPPLGSSDSPFHWTPSTPSPDAKSVGTDRRSPSPISTIPRRSGDTVTESDLSLIPHPTLAGVHQPKSTSSNRPSSPSLLEELQISTKTGRSNKGRASWTEEVRNRLLGLILSCCCCRPTKASPPNTVKLVKIPVERVPTSPRSSEPLQYAVLTAPKLRKSLPLVDPLQTPENAPLIIRPTQQTLKNPAGHPGLIKTHGCEFPTPPNADNKGPNDGHPDVGGLRDEVLESSEQKELSTLDEVDLEDPNLQTPTTARSRWRRDQQHVAKMRADPAYARAQFQKRQEEKLQKCNQLVNPPNSKQDLVNIQAVLFQCTYPDHRGLPSGSCSKPEENGTSNTIPACLSSEDPCEEEACTSREHLAGDWDQLSLSSSTTVGASSESDGEESSAETVTAKEVLTKTSPFTEDSPMQSSDPLADEILEVEETNKPDLEDDNIHAGSAAWSVRAAVEHFERAAREHTNQRFERQLQESPQKKMWRSAKSPTTRVDCNPERLVPFCRTPWHVRGASWASA